MQHSVQRASSKLTSARSVTIGARATAETGDPLATYFKDVAQHPVMSREEEMAVANTIASQRQALWRALLGHPRAVAIACERARALLSGEALPAAELTAIEAAVAAMQGRVTASQRKAFAEAREALAVALAEQDVDGIVTDATLAEVERAAGNVSPKAEAAFAALRVEARAARRTLAASKERFVQANLRLVVMVARRFNHGRLALHDLIQDGNIGLMKAVDRFDPRRGFRFSTYATWWIRHSISRALADTGRAVRLPVHMIEAQGRVARVRREFEALHGREPTDTELATASGLSLERIQRMRWSLIEGPVSLDAPVSDGPGRTLQDLLADADAPPAPELIDSELLHRRLREAFAALPAMEAAVLRERMGMDDEPEQTLREIGERHALSRERIRQIQEQGLARLRREFRRHDLM
ncbi:MAG TPA: sigma-70 family RNA polymerase sigma factor [Nannocystis sp.]